MATVAAYRRLAEQLVLGIERGDHPVGSRLPTEMDLCRSTGLSRNTVRGALGELTRLGLIDRTPGRGTVVVSNRPVDAYQPLAGSADDIVRLVESTKIIRPRLRDLVADAALAQRLGARRGSRWHLFEGTRVMRSSHEPPLCWSEQYLRMGDGGLDALVSGSFTSEDTSRFDIEQVVTAEPLDPSLARALRSEAEVALVITRRKFDESGDLVSVGIHTHPADRYALRTTISRTSADRPSQPSASRS